MLKNQVSPEPVARQLFIANGCSTAVAATAALLAALAVVGRGVARPGFSAGCGRWLRLRSAGCRPLRFDLRGGRKTWRY